MSKQLIDTLSGLIEYRTCGQGQPVLVLHGGHSNSQESLYHSSFDLNEYQLISPSRPGYGQTPLDNNVSPPAAARLLVALLDYLQLPSVTVYGISAGGPTALELAAGYPERVDKLILASAVTKAWLHPQSSLYKKAWSIFHPRVEKYTWKLVQVFSQLSPGLVARSFLAQFSTCKAPAISRQDQEGLQQVLGHYRSGQGFITDLDHQVTGDTLSKIQCKTLILHSKHDNNVPLTHALHAKKKIPHAQLEILHNTWGHFIWLGEGAEQTARITREFLREA